MCVGYNRVIPVMHKQLLCKWSSWCLATEISIVTPQNSYIDQKKHISKMW